MANMRAEGKIQSTALDCALKRENHIDGME
jgi:hypothetical protein